VSGDTAALRVRAGRCERCHREGLPLKDGRCRGCCLHVYLHGPNAEAEPFTQLWIADPLAAGLWIPKGHLGYIPTSDHIERERRLNERRAARRPLIPQLAVPGQEALFTARRDWTPLLDLDRRVESLPELTESARRLADEFATMMRDQQWDTNQKVVNGRTLTILLSWLGADAPILEADVVELSRQDSNLSAKRVCHFLKLRGMLIEDPDLHRDRDLEWIEAALATLPEQIATEVRAWVTVLRGQGRREHEARGYDSIRRYFSGMQSVLEGWSADGVTSLREITHDDIKKAIGDREGHAARYRQTSLRSLFRALRQEQWVFQNPTRGVVVPSVKTLPPSLPSDVLAGLLDHASSAASRFTLALVAVHALPGYDVRHLLTEDLNLSKGRLIVRRGLRRHTIYLEEFTHRLAAEWTAVRHRRWPGSTNPYLLVSQQTAMDPDHPPVNSTMLKHAVQAVKLSLSELRQDRILHEARTSGDPLRLMRLFGISDTTAMRYISAAHPEKTAHLPR
jgi:site-specific recombinase XerC